MQRGFGPPFGSIPMQRALPFQGQFMPPTGGMISSHTPFYAGNIGQGFQHSQAIGGGGGFLSKIFGGGSSPSIAGGTNFTTILTNTQRILGLTQQVMPMVQQYGPIVRSMPAIWKALRTTDDSTDSEPLKSKKDTIPFIQEAAPYINDTHTQSSINEDQPKLESIDGLPLPKLYI